MKYWDLVKATTSVMDDYPGMRLTVRQIYYRLVSPPYQLFENTVRSYKNLVAMLTRARENGDVPWNRIEDRRRRTSGGEAGYRSPKDFLDFWMKVLRNLNKYYSRKKWSTQPSYVEVWVEKEALARLFEQAAEPWKVVVFPTVGYSSLTMFMEAVERFQGIEQPIVILDFRDHDPSGVDMSRDVEDRLRRYGADITVKRIALTIDQVRDLNLASNPTKKADSRTAKYLEQFGDECWELDAYPPDQLMELITHSVEEEVDLEAWEQVETLEAEEKNKIEDGVDEARLYIEDLENTLRKQFEEEE